MGFWDDFVVGIQMPFEFVYDHAIKPSVTMFDKATGVAGKVVDAAGNVATGAGNIAEGLGNLLSGNSNILMYIGLGIVAVVVLPVILEKVL